MDGISWSCAVVDSSIDAPCLVTIVACRTTSCTLTSSSSLRRCVIPSANARSFSLSLRPRRPPSRAIPILITKKRISLNDDSFFRRNETSTERGSPGVPWSLERATVALPRQLGQSLFLEARGCHSVRDFSSVFSVPSSSVRFVSIDSIFSLSTRFLSPCTLCYRNDAGASVVVGQQQSLAVKLSEEEEEEETATQPGGARSWRTETSLAVSRFILCRRCSSPWRSSLPCHACLSLLGRFDFAEHTAKGHKLVPRRRSCAFCNCLCPSRHLTSRFPPPVIDSGHLEYSSGCSRSRSALWTFQRHCVKQAGRLRLQRQCDTQPPPLAPPPRLVLHPPLLSSSPFHCLSCPSSPPIFIRLNSFVIRPAKKSVSSVHYRSDLGPLSRRSHFYQICTKERSIVANSSFFPFSASSSFLSWNDKRGEEESESGACLLFCYRCSAWGKPAGGLVGAWKFRSLWSCCADQFRVLCECSGRCCVCRWRANRLLSSSSSLPSASLLSSLAKSAIESSPAQILRYPFSTAMSVTTIAARTAPRRCSFSAPCSSSSPLCAVCATSPVVLDQPPLQSPQVVVVSSGFENGRMFSDSASPCYRSLCSRLAPVGAVDVAADQVPPAQESLSLRGSPSATSADGDRISSVGDDAINGRKGPLTTTATRSLGHRLKLAPVHPPFPLSIEPVGLPTRLSDGPVDDHLLEEGKDYVDESATTALDRADDVSLINGPIGSIHVIVGPMFAGKTTALLKRMEEEASNGRRVLLVKSAKDNRYATSAVVTHDGWRMHCVAVSSLSQFRSRIGEQAYDQVEVIGIDEAQFFEDLESFCCHAAEKDGKTIIAAGLDGDFRRRKFGSVLDLVPMADSISKLAARCESCGKPAHFTLRKSNDARTELIGGSDLYMPVCRRHYLDAQKAQVAALVTVDSRIKQSC